MKPMHIDACRGLVALYGRAPRSAPLPDIRKRWGDDAECAQNKHPLQMWVDALPVFQREQVHMHYLNWHANMTQEDWDEAWAVAIYNALWH